MHCRNVRDKPRARHAAPTSVRIAMMPSRVGLLTWTYSFTEETRGFAVGAASVEPMSTEAAK